MTSEDFVIWLRGFTQGCNSYAATPAQWDTLNDMLARVEDDYEESTYELGYTVYNYPVTWTYSIS